MLTTTSVRKLDNALLVHALTLRTLCPATLAILATEARRRNLF